MTSDSKNLSNRTVGGGHWLLYVALAFLGGLLTFVGARAQQKATDDASFRKLTDDYCVAWTIGNPDAPAKFYAKSNGLVFYDLAPFSYHGWNEYRDGAKNWFVSTGDSMKLTAGKDLRVSRRGTLAWTTVPMHLVIQQKSGKSDELDLRYTGIWEKHGASWELVHEHISAPTPEN